MNKYRDDKIELNSEHTRHCMAEDIITVLVKPPHMVLGDPTTLHIRVSCIESVHEFKEGAELVTKSGRKYPLVDSSVSAVMDAFIGVKDKE